MRRKIGIIWRYFIAYSAIVIVVIFALALLTSNMIQQRYQEQVEGSLKDYAILASKTFRHAFDGEMADADKLTKELGKRTGVRITLIAYDGAVIGDSEEDPAQMENHSGRPEIKEAFSGRIGRSTRYSTTIKEKMNYVAVPVIDKGRVSGVVRASLKSRGINRLIRRIDMRIAIISVITGAIALILTFLFSSVFSSSVRRIVNLTKRIAGGDFSERINIKRQDELGELSTALNEMSRKLKFLFERLQTSNDELNAIINSMSEGIIVLKDDLRVKLANESFREMFSIDENVKDRSYMEVVRCADLKETVDELLEDKQIKGKKIEFGEKVFIFDGITFKSGDEKGYVMVFHDITATAQIKEIKADFVANASHELKTPLTAIRGYIETFEDEEPEVQKRFIQVIRRNVERMSNLVSDLLLLSRLESSTPQIDIQEVDLLDIVEDVVKLVEKAAEEKEIELKVEIEPGTSVRGDSFLLEQMLLNLLDNAVKYTKRGEVVFRVDREEERVKIEISDTGVGIPSEGLKRIFERFYRVDSARTRELGGTGLGLSIVKHIVQLHDGEIDVESKVGIGTTFTIHLPAPEVNQ